MQKSRNRANKRNYQYLCGNNRIKGAVRFGPIWKIPSTSYEDNVYVGEKATVVINFMGNYDGTFRKWFTITQDPKTTDFDGEWIIF